MTQAEGVSIMTTELFPDSVNDKVFYKESKIKEVNGQEYKGWRQYQMPFGCAYHVLRHFRVILLSFH